MMYQNLINTNNATKLPLPQDAWLLYKFDNHEVIRLHLAPGECMENHINEWRILFFVLRGNGSLNVEGSVFDLGEQDSIAVEAGKERFWKNTGTQTLELLVNKTRESE